MPSQRLLHLSLQHQENIVFALPPSSTSVTSQGWKCGFLQALLWAVLMKVNSIRTLSTETHWVLLDDFSSLLAHGLSFLVYFYPLPSILPFLSILHRVWSSIERFTHLHEFLHGFLQTPDFLHHLYVCSNFWSVRPMVKWVDPPEYPQTSQIKPHPIPLNPLCCHDPLMMVYTSIYHTVQLGD